MGAALATVAAAVTLSVTAAPGPGVSVSDIVEVTDLSGVSVSPDGRWIAFRTDQASIADNGYRLRWFVMPSDRGAAPHLVADGGAALFLDAGVLATETPIWAPDSSGFYMRALLGGQIQVWRASTDGSPPAQITHDPANVRDFTLAPDGRHLTYHVGASRLAIDAAERRAQDDGVLVDGSVDIGQPITRGAWIDGRLASQRFTGQWFARGDILWKTPLGSVTITIPDPPTQKVSTAIGVAASSEGSASGRAMIRPLGAGTQLTIERPGALPVQCRTAQCLAGRVVSAVPMRGSVAWLVTANDPAHQQTLFVWTPGSPRARTIARIAGLLNGGREPSAPCSVARSQLICVEAESTGPPRLVCVDIMSGDRETLFDPNAQLRNRINQSEQHLTWRGPDGAHFTAELILPPTPPPSTGYPLVLQYYYCAGFLRGGLGDELPMLPLASRGIATLCINQPAYAGARNATRDYRRALGGIEAIVARLPWARLIDRKHIGMWGLSFGSEITMAAAEHSTLLAAISLATEPLEPNYYWYYSVAGNSIGPTFLKNWHVRAPSSDLRSWKVHSPALNVSQIHAPVLLQLSEQEARISMQFYSSLSRTSTPVELYAFANEPHIKEQPRHKAAAYQRNLDWFRFWLQHAEDPAPDRVEQYARWRALEIRRSATRLGKNSARQ